MQKLDEQMEFEERLVKPIEYVGTQRSQFTHRKKQVRIKTVAAKLKKNETLPVEEAKSPDPLPPKWIKVLISRRRTLDPKTGFGTTYSLLAPGGYGLAILRRLQYSGCKAIALREWLSIHMESGVRLFPYDFPETTAGRDWLELKINEMQEKYLRRPPAKRVNYQVTKCPNIFSLTVRPKRVVIMVDAVLRGAIRSGSGLFMMSWDDLKGQYDLLEDEGKGDAGLCNYEIALR